MASLLSWLSSKIGSKPHVPVKPMVHAAEVNSDVVTGFEFCSTMLLTTPLKILRRHGEKRINVPSGEHEMNRHFIWIPTVDPALDFLDEGGTMSSIVGYIPRNGGNFLQFLMEFRTLIESPIFNLEELDQVEIRMEWIRDILPIRCKQNFLPKLSRQSRNPHWLYELVLTESVATPRYGLQAHHLRAMHKKGYKTIADILAAPDAALLKLKGIGPARLAKIRLAAMSGCHR